MPSFRLLHHACILFFFLAASSHADEELALETPEGIAMKVVTREATALYRAADLQSPNEPLQAFEFFYVLPAVAGGTEPQANGFYRVASSNKTLKAAGFVPADKGVIWPHAQCAGFTSFGDRERVLFFASLDEARNWLTGQTGSESKAISREPAQKQQALFPLLQVETIEHDGDTIEIYRVAYLAGQGANEPPDAPTLSTPSLATKSSTVPATAIARSGRESAPRNREELKQSFKLQVCFVLDTTASMEQFIEGMKTAIAQIARDVGGNPALQNRVEFALVAYRDKLADDLGNAELEYVAKSVSPFTSNHSAFQAAVADVHSAAIGSEDHPEDVLAGLQMALRDLKWSKAASKHVVLIGDAPAQTSTDGYKNTTRQTLEGITALAQPTGAQAAFDRIQIHGLRVVSDMPQETEEHFSTLTRGRETPGLHYAYAASGDEQKFVRDLIARLTDVADLTQLVVQGQFDQIDRQAKQAAAGSDKQRLLGPIVEMLQATQTGGTEATFQEGFAAVLDRHGNRCLEPHILVSNSQLKLFDSALNFCIVSLETAGDPGSRNVQKVVTSLQVMATGVNLKEEFTADTPLADVLTKILGVPVRNPIFAMTPKRLAAMTARDFEGWRDQVRASQSICRNHLENGSIWFSLGTGKAAKSLDLQAFIKVSDLP